jgi:hypothetical protein
MRGRRIAYSVLVGTFEWKRPRRRGLRWEGNIKKDLREMG